MWQDQAAKTIRWAKNHVQTIKPEDKAGWRTDFPPKKGSGPGLDRGHSSFLKMAARLLPLETQELSQTKREQSAHKYKAEAPFNADHQSSCVG